MIDNKKEAEGKNGYILWFNGNEWHKNIGFFGVISKKQ